MVPEACVSTKFCCSKFHAFQNCDMSTFDGCAFGLPIVTVKPGALVVAAASATAPMRPLIPKHNPTPNANPSAKKSHAAFHLIVFMFGSITRCYTVCMLTRYVQHGVTWVDLVAPTPQEVRGLMHEFAVEPIIAEELLLPSFQPKVERRGEHIYLILHFPVLRGMGQRPE